MAGANSIFYGDRLLTTDNPESDHDLQLFAKLGIHMQANQKAEAHAKQMAEQITELTA